MFVKPLHGELVGRCCRERSDVRRPLHLWRCWFLVFKLSDRTVYCANRAIDCAIVLVLFPTQDHLGGMDALSELIGQRLIEGQKRLSFIGPPKEIGVVAEWTTTAAFVAELLQREDHRRSWHVKPNVEVTGRRRRGAWAARRNMNNERVAAQVPCRWRSG